MRKMTFADMISGFFQRNVGCKVGQGVLAIEGSTTAVMMVTTI